MLSLLYAFVCAILKNQNNQKKKKKNNSNNAVLGYLVQQGYHDTAEAFGVETDADPTSIEDRQRTLLANKWTVIVRLQRKVCRCFTPFFFFFFFSFPVPLVCICMRISMFHSSPTFYFVVQLRLFLSLSLLNSLELS
jgi:LisH